MLQISNTCSLTDLQRFLPQLESLQLESGLGEGLLPQQLHFLHSCSYPGEEKCQLRLSRLTFLQVTEAVSWRCSLPVMQHSCVACERLLCYYRGLSWKAVGAGFPALPAVVLEHVEGGVGEEGGASHVLVARVFLWESQLLHHNLTVAQQPIQAQLPADEKHENGV